MNIRPIVQHVSSSVAAVRILSSHSNSDLVQIGHSRSVGTSRYMIFSNVFKEILLSHLSLVLVITAHCECILQVDFL